MKSAKSMACLSHRYSFDNEPNPTFIFTTAHACLRHAGLSHMWFSIFPKDMIEPPISIVLHSLGDVVRQRQIIVIPVVLYGHLDAYDMEQARLAPAPIVIATEAI